LPCIRAALALIAAAIASPETLARTPQSAASPLASTDPAGAISDLDREVATALASKDPVPVEQLYNLGVRLYRANRLADAKSIFDTAATRAKADLASRSMYNRGTAAYAESLESMRAAGQNGEAPANPQELQQKVMQQLEQALRALKDAARADPTNADARANAELAHRVLKELKKQQQEQKQDQQQQQQDQQQKQDQQQQQQDQQQKQDQQQQQQDQQQNQDQQQQQQDQQQKQDQQQQQQDQQQKQDQQQQQQDQQQKQDQQQQQQDQQQKQDQQQQQQDQQQKQDQQQNQDQQQPQPGDSAQGKQQERPLTKQEVERLLQKIRDKEKQRLKERLARERARTQPAPKDW
jgi:hypothetical protein